MKAGKAFQICDFSETYWEAEQILGDVEMIIKMTRNRKKQTVPETPVDRWGNKLEIPGTNGTGQANEDQGRDSAATVPIIS